MLSRIMRDGKVFVATLAFPLLLGIGCTGGVGSADLLAGLDDRSADLSAEKRGSSKVAPASSSGSEVCKLDEVPSASCEVCDPHLDPIEKTLERAGTGLS